MEYVRTITIPTKDEETGKRTIKALIALNDLLSVENLEELAALSKEKPKWVEKSRPFLKQYKNML